MASSIVNPFGTATVSLAASDKIAVYSLAETSVFQVVGYPNYPEQNTLLSTDTGLYTSAAFSAAGTVLIAAGASPVFYTVGTDPVIPEIGNFQTQAAPNVLNATGALTSAMILGGIVTSTTGAAVAATLPTGAVLDAASAFDVNESFDWSVINTGGNAFTVTAATGHTIVGVAAVATVTSGRWRTRKTAADTFVSYRIG